MSHLNLTVVSPAPVREQISDLYNAATPLDISVALAGTIFLLSTVLRVWPKDSTQMPRMWGLPVIGAWAFFSNRYGFILSGLKRMSGNFKFYVREHPVVVLDGEEERRLFFWTKDFSLAEGYKVLFSGAPALKDINVKAEHMGEDNAVTWFGKRLTALLKRERVDKVLPQMFDDLARLTKRWGESGCFDPFEDMYNMVFQLTVRAAAADEISDDPEKVAELLKNYWIVDNSSTAKTVLLSWYPWQEKKDKVAATGAIYGLVKDVIDERQRTGARKEDALQFLLDQGDNVNDVVGFIMATLFAGVVNTGMMSAWVLLHLDANREWKAKVIDEIRSFLAKYSDPTADLPTQLGQLSMATWEDEMPLLELCLRETMRLIVSFTLLRRNIGKDITLPDGKVIKAGDFVVLPTAKSHQNSDIYPNPDRFDPMRYTPGHEEDKKQHGGFLGWGFGRHPCLGKIFRDTNGWTQVGNGGVDCFSPVLDVRVRGR